ncbi:HAMP domain-containing histidine kinase [Nostoc sp. FACHB-152]|uniref:sensor histidine kinase n=1 Tax=unclassified Nostoc TaxID=2593658 RepID=UPI00168705C3|nr:MULTISPECIES: HAMP domain-containing sensor histidine kinase [unclassified Nostoc]MBD2451471.1 HAMP domain-containing histidine kinase [Nostoc sp. FACHB-152]MBD2472512.1 HAMP domain-containing histidine kinase [Nostoc sp. FACHB-145]
MFNRSRRNLAHWFILSMGGILLFFSGTLYYQEAVQQQEVIDLMLYKKARVITANVRYKTYQGQKRVFLKHLPVLGNNPPPADTEINYARWYDTEGNLKRYFGQLPQKKLNPTFEFETLKITDNSDVVPQEIWLREITLPVHYQGELIGYLQMAMPTTRAQESLNRFLLLLISTVLIALGVTSLTGWFLGGLAMQPIHLSYQQLERFTAHASHELRTPLAAILSNAQVGLLAPMEDSASKHLRLEKVAEVAKSMNTLIGNLLFLARRAGRLAPESLKKVDLNDLLRELIQSQSVKIAAEHLNFKVDFAEYKIVARVEPELLCQAVMNLISNACKYTPTGGMVELRLFIKSGQVVIQVADNGIGIAAADLPHIFEQFYRVEQKTNSANSFGLGLAIAQQIIEAHGGHLSSKSELGKGSVFQIKLPL